MHIICFSARGDVQKIVERCFRKVFLCIVLVQRYSCVIFVDCIKGVSLKMFVKDRVQVLNRYERPL